MVGVVFRVDFGDLEVVYVGGGDGFFGCFRVVEVGVGMRG